MHTHRTKLQTQAPHVRAVICRPLDCPATVEELQRFRKQLFVDELGWDLRVCGERETDEFDTERTVHCAIYLDGALVGGFRAVRTSEQYLACKIFPQLATVRDYPRQADVWEISRFGILPGNHCQLLAKLNYALMFHFGRSRAARALVAIADLTYERYLRTLGIKTRRYGHPQVIGTDRFGRDLVAVAGEIPLHGQASPRLSTLIKLAEELEITDATLVQGPTAVSA